MDLWNNVTNMNTKMKCNLDYKSVYAFAFLFDFCRDKSDEKGKRPGYVVIRDKREI